MSRIGRKPISIPSGVTVTVADGVAVVKGVKGELRVALLPKLSLSISEQSVEVNRSSEDKQTRANHGLVRSLLKNQIEGVSQGYKKTLQLIGTGYRVAMKGAGLTLSLGFSHPVVVDAPAGIKLSIEGSDLIHIEGIDKQLVGQVAADIRQLRPPEPYKGKGIRYQDEVVRRKQGKAAA